MERNNEGDWRRTQNIPTSLIDINVIKLWHPVLFNYMLCRNFLYNYVTLAGHFHVRHYCVCITIIFIKSIITIKRTPHVHFFCGHYEAGNIFFEIHTTLDVDLKQ
jgi:hypothetical protein